MPYRVYVVGTEYTRDYRTKTKALKVARRIRTKEKRWQQSKT